MSPRVYVASKSKHGAMWRAFRARNDGRVVVTSTWIDESDAGQTDDFSDLWTRCVSEALSSDFLIAYHEPGDEWKGAFIEIGAALAHGKRVYVHGDPPGSWVSHPNVHRIDGVDAPVHAWWQARRPGA